MSDEADVAKREAMQALEIRQREILQRLMERHPATLEASLIDDGYGRDEIAEACRRLVWLAERAESVNAD